MPLGDRIRRARRRRIRDGDSYTIDEENRDEIELDLPDRRDEPPTMAQGEPWGWPDDDEHRERPRGWPGPDHSVERERGDPGPYDGSWEPPGEVR